MQAALPFPNFPEDDALAVHGHRPTKPPPVAVCLTQARNDYDDAEQRGASGEMRRAQARVDWLLIQNGLSSVPPQHLKYEPAYGPNQPMQREDHPAYMH